MDTNGIVRIVNWNSDTWMPIANTKKAQGAREVDTWWITSINEGNKDIYATLCKNASVLSESRLFSMREFSSNGNFESLDLIFEILTNLNRNLLVFIILDSKVEKNSRLENKTPQIGV